MFSRPPPPPPRTYRYLKQANHADSDKKSTASANPTRKQLEQTGILTINKTAAADSLPMKRVNQIDSISKAAAVVGQPKRQVEQNAIPSRSKTEVADRLRNKNMSKEDDHQIAAASASLPRKPVEQANIPKINKTAAAAVSLPKSQINKVGSPVQVTASGSLPDPDSPVEAATVCGHPKKHVEKANDSTINSTAVSSPPNKQEELFDGAGSQTAQLKIFREEREGKAVLLPFLHPGLNCYARWREDGVWYRCELITNEPVHHQITVLFTDYGNQDTVDVRNELVILPTDIASEDDKDEYVLKDLEDVQNFLESEAAQAEASAAAEATAAVELACGISQELHLTHVSPIFFNRIKFKKFVEVNTVQSCPTKNQLYRSTRPLKLLSRI